MTLKDILSLPELEGRLLTLPQTQGFIAAMASAPHTLPPEEWLPFIWGGEEVAPFISGEQLELFAQQVIALWNDYRPALLDGDWQWPQECQLSEEEIVTEQTKQFCEGMLQGWQLARDDWETLMPEASADNALLGGVLLSLSMLYDPETAMATLEAQGIQGLDQFAEIFSAMPMMLCGITQKGAILAQEF